MQELDDEDDDKPAEKAPPKYVVSGGLTGFGVAQDLLHIDFSPPEEAPKEFKAMPFNSKRLTTLKSGLSGRAARHLWNYRVIADPNPESRRAFTGPSAAGTGAMPQDQAALSTRACTLVVLDTVLQAESALKTIAIESWQQLCLPQATAAK